MGKRILLLVVFLSLALCSNALAASFAYVSSLYSDTVSVVDTTTNEVVKTVKVSAGPYGIAVTPDGSRVYVAISGGANNVSVINAFTNAVVDNIAAGVYPQGVAITPDGKKAYVTNAGDGTVSVSDIATNTVVKTVQVGDSPYGIDITPDGKKVYVASRANNISVIDTTTYSVAAIEIGYYPVGVAVTPDGTKAYVTYWGTPNSVAVIDTSSNTIIKTVEVGSGPSGVAVTPDGSKVYVANHYSNNVSVVDASTNTVVETIGVGTMPSGLAITPDGSKVYVMNHWSHNVSVIDTATNTIDKTIGEVGPVPASFGKFIGPDIIASTTIEGLIECINQYLSSGEIDNSGIANSLIAKLNNALDAKNSGDDQTADNIMQAFINQVEAQSGKHISKNVADMLINTATFIINN